MWIRIFDVQELCKMEEFVDILEHECDLVVAIPLLVLNTQLD